MKGEIPMSYEDRSQFYRETPDDDRPCTLCGDEEVTAVTWDNIPLCTPCWLFREKVLHGVADMETAHA